MRPSALVNPPVTAGDSGALTHTSLPAELALPPAKAAPPAPGPPLRPEAGCDVPGPEHAASAWHMGRAAPSLPRASQPGPASDSTVDTHMPSAPAINWSWRALPRLNEQRYCVTCQRAWPCDYIEPL